MSRSGAARPETVPAARRLSAAGRKPISTRRSTRSWGSPASRSHNADAIEELDINPLIVCAEGQGAWVADALWSLDASEQLSSVGGASIAMNARSNDRSTTRREGAILEVTLDRPKANAIDLKTSRLMGETFKAFRDDPGTARRHRQDGRRQVLLRRLGPQGGGRAAMRSTATMASAGSAGCRNCAT